MGSSLLAKVSEASRLCVWMPEFNFIHFYDYLFKRQIYLFLTRKQIYFINVIGINPSPCALYLKLFLFFFFCFFSCYVSIGSWLLLVYVLHVSKCVTLTTQRKWALQEGLWQSGKLTTATSVRPSLVLLGSWLCNNLLWGPETEQWLSECALTRCWWPTWH